MTTPILLTPHQCDAVSFVIEKLSDGEQLVAIRGYAGTGKTSLIPSLRDLITSTLDLPTAVGSPTHRAAMILRKKGILDASTIHNLALTPYFLADYAWAHRWLGEDCPARAGVVEERTPDVNGVPSLLAQATDKPKGLMQRVRRHGVKKVLAALGIHGKDFFDGFGAKQGEGVLIVDEASMVGEETLKLCLEAFPQVVLVGDPGQLPPVKDHSRLAEVVGFDLEQIHRQAEGNPIIQLAYAARRRDADWRTLKQMPGHVETLLHVPDPTIFLIAPLIVWRNDTRIECTKGIRAALGYWHGKVYAGEPLVCRSTSAADRAEGLLNNSLWRIADVSKLDERLVSIYEEGKEDEPLSVRLHLEDVDGDEVPEDAVPFRFGYCLTAHTAQGGEWPVVYISKPDLLAHQAFCKKRRTDEHAQWSYTAITRAKDTLCFLQEHRFLVHEDTPSAATPEEDTSMPIVMTPTVDEPTLQVPSKAQEPRAPLTGDIDDPPVPEGVTALAEPLNVKPVVSNSTLPALPDGSLALLQGYSQHLSRKLEEWYLDFHRGSMRGLDDSMQSVKRWLETVSAHNEHAEYSLANALTSLAHGSLGVPPYQVQLQVRTPQGFSMALTITKGSSAELIEELGRLEPWLVANGYTATETAMVA